MGYTYKKDGYWDLRKYMRYQEMEEKIKNITSEVYEELIKLFDKKLNVFFCTVHMHVGILIWNQMLIS